MAKKVKSKGQGKKPKRTVLPNQEETPYDRACAALLLKYGEDSYQKVIGNIDKLRNVLQEYLDARTQLESNEKEKLKKIQKQGHQNNKAATKNK